MSAIGDETSAMIVTGDETIMTTTAREIATLIDTATTTDLAPATAIAMIRDMNHHVPVPPLTTTSEIVECVTLHRPAAEACPHHPHLNHRNRQLNQRKRRPKGKVRLKRMRMQMQMQWRQ